MLHMISYSYPPDNVPAAHRPYQLAAYLQKAGVPVRVHSRFGRHAAEGPSSGIANVVLPVAMKSNFKRRALSRLNALLNRILQVDKALPWAVKTFPGIVWLLLRERIEARQRPVVWATCPLPSNVYLAGLAAFLAGAHLHLDLRDAIDGINSQRAPWLTRFVVSRASSLTAVTETLARYIDESGFGPPATVVFNGVSSESLSHAEQGVANDSGWVEISYTGAVYGGDRPYIAAIEMIANVARTLPDTVRGVRLTIAGREDLSGLPAKYGHDRFSVNLTGEVSKKMALMMTGASEINLILVGRGRAHRCGIPLKTFDLLGTGRPILYFGPRDSDAVLFLERFAPDLYCSVDSEQSEPADLVSFRSWLLDVRRSPSAPKREPSSESQSAQIARLLGVMP